MDRPESTGGKNSDVAIVVTKKKKEPGAEAKKSASIRPKGGLQIQEAVKREKGSISTFRGRKREDGEKRGAHRTINKENHLGDLSTT